MNNTLSVTTTKKIRKPLSFDLVIAAVFIAFSLVSMVLCVTHYSEVFSSLFLLPFFFCITCIVFINVFKDILHHLVRLSVIGLYFVRNSLTPLTMALGNYESLNITFESGDVVKAILLLSYETFVVFFFINLFVQKRSILRLAKGNEPCSFSRSISENGGADVSLKGGLLFKTAVLVLTVLMIACVIIVPDITKSYKNLWTTSTSELITTFSNIQDYSPGTFHRILYSFFCFFFTPMLIVWLGMLITLVRRVLGDKKIGVILSAGIAMISTFFVSETSLLTVFTILILLVYTMKLFSKNKRFVKLFSGISLVLVFALMMGMRMTAGVYESGSFFGSLAKTLNAYIPGVYNVSGMWGVTVPNKFETFYLDIYTGIPLRSIIPPLVDGQRLSDHFNAQIGSTIQILPLIGQSFFYFYGFAPFVPCLLVWWALKMEEKMEKVRSCYYYLALFSSSIIIVSSVLIYDLSIIVTFSTRIVFPILLLSYLDERKYR